MIRLPLTSTLFPYTTLFRSRLDAGEVRAGVGDVPGASGGLQRVDRAIAIEATLREDGERNGLAAAIDWVVAAGRSEEHTSELQSLTNLVCRLLLEKKKKTKK